MGLGTIHQSVSVYMSLVLKIFVTSLQDKYVLMCGLKIYGNINEKSSDSVISVCGITHPE